jgi:hypothetical protein
MHKMLFFLPLLYFFKHISSFYQGREKKKTSKKNVDGRSTSSHDSKKFRTRSMEKQRGMAFGFWKTATAVKKPDRYIDISSFTSPHNKYTEKFLSDGESRF